MRGIDQHREQLDTELRKFLDREIAQVDPIERGVLLIATYEMLHRPDIPYRVVINEAVELAKSYGGTDGFKYVNGVLDRLAADARPHEVGRR